jgi:hypothetical protein
LDAISGAGLGRIVVGEYWRAWILVGNWHWHSEGRDIGWANAITFEVLAQTLITLYDPDHCFKYDGDHTGVVEGW